MPDAGGSAAVGETRGRHNHRQVGGITARGGRAVKRRRPGGGRPSHEPPFWRISRSWSLRRPWSRSVESTMPARVLIVDDEPDILDLLRTLLGLASGVHGPTTYYMLCPSESAR